MQYGVEKKDKVKITSGAHCYADLHLDPKERGYLRSQGIVEKDWEMTSFRVPSRILDELDMLFPSRRKKQ